MEGIENNTGNMENVRYEHWGDISEVDDGVVADVEGDVMTPLASDEREAEDLHVPTATGTSSLDGYYLSLQRRSSAKQRLAKLPPTSTQSSSGSLHALAEEGQDPGPRRTQSTRSHESRRSASQSKISSSPIIRPAFYPEQSFASLSGQNNVSRPHPVLRTRSSHPAQNLLYNDIKSKSLPPGRKTADNTPMSSPGLFTPASIRQAHDNRSGSPQLHHLQAPKETHTAEIEHDVYSGNKFINNYEIVTELGRGEHGKVKLGRDVERDNMVAIKIVPRFSAKRRLGDLGTPKDRTKREVAILKKARHPHVVSLLEVIDDPNKNKVYLILEYVDKGEIKWRKSGVREICMINTRRFEEEKRGMHASLLPSEKDMFTVRQAAYRHDQAERLRDRGFQHVPNWSLEYAGDTDDESETHDMSRSISRQMTNTSTPSRGNSQDEYPGDLRETPSWSGPMSGAYGPDAYRSRKFSIAMSAISHMSSEIEFDRDDDQHSYVPALTIEEARRAFRDILLGLEFLHFIGIIHRDIKPANLLSASNGTVKISDFGVSYLGRPTTDEEADNKVSESDATPLDDEKELARSVGTPAFWAPEVCYEDPAMFADGKDPKITGALDLWALGITLYCMIYARLPFYAGEGIGLHESVCTEEVFCPSTRLVPVDTTSPEFLTHSREPINSHKRLDYDLKFEPVPEHVRDLIARLLTKDPAHRITIEEAKRHPWVVEGIHNQSEWLHSPEIEKEGMKNILDINEREMSHAVVKRNIIERTLNSVSRLAGNLLGRSNKDARKRASSTATSAGSSSESLHSPATSSASTIGKNEKLKEARRTSLRGEELVQALKASREAPEHPLAQSQTASPDSREQPSYFSGTKALSTGHTPTLDQDRRPRGPDRTVSILSTAESVKTIRASQFQRMDAGHNVEVGPEMSLKSRIDGLWEGTTKTLNRLASRDRSSRSRSPPRPITESDGHAGPSLAVSNTYASGAIQTPNVLRAVDKSPVRSHHSPFRAPASAESEYAQAQQMNHRRHIQEAQSRAEAATIERHDPIPDECPPSPDDETFDQSLPSSIQVSPFDTGMQTAVSASTIASSLDQFDNSSVSNPSHGINSGASSPPEGFISAEYKDIPHHPNMHTADTEPAFMRTADTVTMHGRPQPATATGKPLQQEREYYEDGDDEDDSDEEGIVMGGPKRG